MRTEPLSSVAANLLRQSLEHLAVPTLVVSGSANTARILIANAAARSCGFEETISANSTAANSTATNNAATNSTSADGQILAHLQPPEADREAIESAIHDGLAALRRWNLASGTTVTLRVTPLRRESSGEGRDAQPEQTPSADGSQSIGHLATVSWEQPGPSQHLPTTNLPKTLHAAATYASGEHARAQRDLHDWLARTPITGANLGEIVRKVTRRLASVYDIERVSVWRFSEDGMQLCCSDLYERSNDQHSSGQVLLETNCRGEFDTLRRSIYIDIHDTLSDTRVADYRDSNIAPQNITSKLNAVIRFGGRCYGTLCLEHVAVPHVWQQTEIDFACTVASYLASALESLARAKAVELLREREQFLSAIFQGSPIGIQVFAPDGTSLRMNSGMQHILGLPTLNYDAGTYNLLDDPQAQATGMDVVFGKALAGQATRIDRYEVDYTTEAYRTSRRRREKYWLDSVFFPVLHDDNKVQAVVVFAWEATDRVTADADRERLEQQLRQSQKLEAVGQLAGGVAHDFNNILTAVRGFADILGMELDSDDSRSELVQQVRMAADRGTALTKQLLTFAGRQMTRVEVFDASNAIIEMLPMLRRLLETNIQLELAAKSAAPIEADRSQIQQVVLNLLVNARDAMPDGGTIHIDVAIAPGDDGKPAMILSVADTGQGMDDATKARIFEPFFTTKQPGRGTGLGLSTIYGIVTESGGSVSVQSEPQKGSTFRVTWPLAEQPTRDEPSQEPAAPARGHETVLVVEDDEANRLLAASVLKKSGYNVLAVESGHAALELAKTVDSIDLLLTDVVMPGIGGRLLADEMARARPDLRVVFMSGYTSDAVIRDEVEKHKVDFLAKPYSAVALTEIVRAALDQ